MSYKFKQAFPDYESYSNEDYYMNEIPDKILITIGQTLPRQLHKLKQIQPALSLDGTAKNMCDKVSYYTGNEGTTNWGWDFIIRDFQRQLGDLKFLKFHKFMDCVVELSLFGIDTVEELNEIFDDNNFGYRLTDDSDNPWRCINPGIGHAVDIDEVIVTTADICKQSAEHIKQAKEQLTKASNLRARKDAIRDCLSAMEALMKHVTHTTDIKDADRIMRDDPETWGQSRIVREGISLWNMFHNDYRDIRHGDFDISDITYEETVFFTDKLLAYVKYLSSVAIEKDIE